MSDEESYERFREHGVFRYELESDSFSKLLMREFERQFCNDPAYKVEVARKLMVELNIFDKFKNEWSKNGFTGTVTEWFAMCSCFGIDPIIPIMQVDNIFSKNS